MIASLALACVVHIVPVGPVRERPFLRAAARVARLYRPLGVRIRRGRPMRALVYPQSASVYHWRAELDLHEAKRPGRVLFVAPRVFTAAGRRGGGIANICGGPAIAYGTYWLRLAHEIGHALCATHVQEPSVMATGWDKRPWFAEQTLQELRCVDRWRQ